MVYFCKYHYKVKTYVDHPMNCDNGSDYLEEVA